MKHDNYYEVRCRTYSECGRRLGELTGDWVRETIRKKREGDPDWNKKIENSKKYLSPSKKAFPNLLEELKAYAESARVSFGELWVLCLGDEAVAGERCTTLIANGGKLISHNEDWSPEAKDELCILKRQIGEDVLLEFFYQGGLGGNSISINSNGYIQGINTLTHSDRQTGVPRNVYCRWLAETSDPAKDFVKMQSIKRSSGYNHNIVSSAGAVWNIEASASKAIICTPGLPYVHTNHYLSALKKHECDDGSTATFERYRKAKSLVKEKMSVEDIIAVSGDESDGPIKSIFNERTIGRMVVDLEQNEMYAWLKREEEKGWVKYPINFISR